MHSAGAAALLRQTSLTEADLQAMARQAAQAPFLPAPQRDAAVQAAEAALKRDGGA